MDPFKRNFITNASVSARMAGAHFPDMWAAEAALESRFGRSQLYIDGWNAFGLKQKQHPIFGTLSLPTREYLGGEWKVVNANFVKYPDLDACFADRLATLERLAPAYPHYKAALEAVEPEIYIQEVSMTWSTDPNRAKSVLTIYRDYLSDLIQPA